MEDKNKKDSFAIIMQMYQNKLTTWSGKKKVKEIYGKWYNYLRVQEEDFIINNITSEINLPLFLKSFAKFVIFYMVIIGQCWHSKPLKQK